MATDKVDDPNVCTCGTCGYPWRRGQDGYHSCSAQMTKTIQRMRDEAKDIHEKIVLYSKPEAATGFESGQYQQSLDRLAELGKDPQ